MVHSRTIRAGIVGVGNCACSFAQAISAAARGELGSGVEHEFIHEYSVADIEVVSAFDIDRRKVGATFCEAAFAPPNCTTRYFDIDNSSAVVTVGARLDGVAEHMLEVIDVHPDSDSQTIERVIAQLDRSQTEVLLLYLPVGAIRASEFYAEAALNAGCAVVNCTPSPLATNPKWLSRFKDRGLPLLGDDIKSHMGATTVHRALLELLARKGVKVTNTHQLNIGGNTDFLNMRSMRRASTKRTSKTAALMHLLESHAECSVGPSDFVPYLKDNKICHISIQGTSLLGMNVSMEVKLSVEDSPNSAAVVIDAVRFAKVAFTNSDPGFLEAVCATLFKNPNRQLKDSEALDRVSTMLAGDKIAS